MNWWKRYSQQLAMPWYDPSALIQPPPPNPDGLSPELLPYRQEIVEEARSEPVSQLVSNYMPATEADLLFILKASGSGWKKIEFSTGANPIFIIFSEDRGTTEVIEMGDFDRVRNAEEWVSNADPTDYIQFPEENFWSDIDGDYKVYHGTYEEHLPSIMKKGLLPMAETRGISNKNAPAGVYTSAEYETAANSYEVVIEIDVGAMKRNKYMPQAEMEEPVQEDQQRRILADFIGLYDYIGDESAYNSDGLREDTIVFYGRIPPRYLKVVTQ